MVLNLFWLRAIFGELRILNYHFWEMSSDLSKISKIMTLNCFSFVYYSWKNLLLTPPTPPPASLPFAITFTTVHRRLSWPKAIEICLQLYANDVNTLLKYYNWKCNRKEIVPMLKISSKRFLQWWHPTYLHVDVEKGNTMCCLVTISNFFNRFIVLDSKVRGNWTNLRWKIPLT